MDALRVENLCKRYSGGFALENVSFSLAEGSIMGLIGANGAGKTTTLKALMGYLRPDAGTVTLFGQPFPPENTVLRQHTGFVSGGVDYFPRKRLSAITAATRPFYANWDEAAYQNCLRTFELDERKRTAELSAGMKVKYQLALALSHRAGLLILDEPTSGLDPVSRDELLELFLTLAEERGVSILFSSHITSDLEKCARTITYLQRGRVLCSEEQSALLNRWRLVRGTPEQLAGAELTGLTGLRRHAGTVEGLCPAEQAARFPAGTVKPAGLEDIMVHLEREARA